MRKGFRLPQLVLVLLAGATVGVLGALLSWAGNPPNMGICIACFLRDITGALGLHRVAAGQYLRPEIPAIVLGACLAALAGKEWIPRSAPAPAISFLLGAFMAIGALVFLGCPVRMVLRLAGGDLNALTGLGGFIAGVLAGAFLVRQGYCIGRSARGATLPLWVMPLLAGGLVTLVLARPAFVFFGRQGPAGMSAPILASVGAGLAVGLLAHRARLCFAGGIRDMALIRSPHLLWGLVAALAGAAVTNLVLGRVRIGFGGQPIAHAVHVWNFLGMALVGLAAVLLGGCPLRQLVLASGGDGSAFLAVGGMLVGAAIAHNFDLAASAAGVPLGGKVAVGAGLLICLGIGWVLREQ